MLHIVIRKIILFFALSVFALQISKSQEIVWNAGMYTFFDNREYFNEYAIPQSILGVSAFGDVGFKIDERNEFYGGANILHEFGANPDSISLSPILYFHHKGVNKELYMGVFPRHNLMQMPRLILSDTLNYYRPNIEGIYIGYDYGVGKQSVWLDWTSRQTLVDHEAFMICASGELGNNIISLKHYFMMYHFAGIGADVASRIRDNGAGMITPTINLTSFTPLDSLSFSTGVAGSYDRLRTYYDLIFSFGSISELYAEYKGFGIRSMLYLGEGHDIMLGDRMYQAKKYNRTDLIYKVLKKGRVSGNVEFSTHFVPGAVDFTQQFAVYIDISGNKQINQKKEQQNNL